MRPYGGIRHRCRLSKNPADASTVSASARADEVRDQYCEESLRQPFADPHPDFRSVIVSQTHTCGDKQGRISARETALRMKPLRLLVATVLALILVSCVAWPTRAEDSLRPCTDVFSEPNASYQGEVQRALLPEPTLWTTRPIARAVVLPSFEAEWVVSLYLEQGAGRVDLRWAEDRIGSEPADGRSGSPDEDAVDEVPIRAATATIDSELAKAIEELWRTELMNVGPPQERWTSDGASYHVSAWVRGYGHLCGRAISSASAENPRLLAIADLLRTVVEENHRRPEVERELWKLLGRREPGKQ